MRAKAYFATGTAITVAGVIVAPDVTVAVIFAVAVFLLVTGAHEEPRDDK